MMIAESQEEVRLVLAEVDRFCTRAVEPLASRPESPMRPDAVERLLAEARAMGVVAAEAPGAGLWDDATEGPARSARVLARLARTNAGVAWAAHTVSLAAVIARRVGVHAGGIGAIAVQGRFGLGRGALARLLRGDALAEDDRRMLVDVYGLEAPRWITAPHRLDWLLLPFVAEGALHWTRVPRDKARVEVHSHAHGFDELATMSVRASPVSGASSAPPRAAAACFAEALGAASLASMAIALGAAERAIDRAREYAHLRRQGGELIERHPAVQGLLGSARAATETVSATLWSLAAEPLGVAGLPRLLAARSEAQPLLCRAANDAMQVLGGTGYMRDAGIEKVVRDVNHLRVTHGSPSELRLVVGEWTAHV